MEGAYIILVNNVHISSEKSKMRNTRQSSGAFVPLAAVFNHPILSE